VGKSSIEWTDETWNPVVGCTEVSPGCKHCYAKVMAARQVLMSAAHGRQSVYLRVVDAQRRRWTHEVELLHERLLEPLDYKPGSKVFVVSMGDPFHDGVPFEFIEQMWAVMAATPAVSFQVLTKRPERMVEFLRWLTGRERGVNVGTKALPPVAATLALLLLDALPNVWLGVSVEDQQRADERIPYLLAAPAAVRFLSAEPLLGAIDLGRWLGDYDCHGCRGRFWSDELNEHGLTCVDIEQDPNYPDQERTRDVCPHCGQADLGTGDVGPVGEADYEGEPRLHLVITGGESGQGARWMNPAWVRSLRDQCEASGVAFFFKQWGGVHKGKTGRELDGRTHDAMPVEGGTA